MSEVTDISLLRPEDATLLQITCSVFFSIYNFGFDHQAGSSRNHIEFLMGQDYLQVHEIQGLDSVVLETVKKKVADRR